MQARKKSNHRRQGAKFSPKKPASRPVKRQNASNEKGWDGVAGWYDKLVGADGSDYHRNVILPGVMELLDISDGESVADVCCGQGVLVKHLISAGASQVLGVDASDQLIKSAKKRYGDLRQVSFEIADACAEANWANGRFDKAACVMAVHDVPDAGALMKNISKTLKQNGTAVIVMMHPCFRIPKESHWGWDNDQGIQFRRLDKYGSSLEIGITTRPGLGTNEKTAFYHRPLAEIITMIGDAGMAVNKCTELFSHRRSQAGPFSKAEHRAAEEFPLFLGLRASKA
ncbi:MAG: class I SAM-dependent methyltransferase [Akkermansiaceae bacterium]